MAVKSHAVQRGILVEPSFALGPMETRDLDQDGLSQDMQDGCSQQCDFPSMRTLLAVSTRICFILQKYRSVVHSPVLCSLVWMSDKQVE